MRKVTAFFLNFESTTSAGDKIADGNDRIFGDLDHDWLVGGTGSDHLYGGLGDDVMNADDNLETNDGANDSPDQPLFADPDIVFGGGGLDYMWANTSADRLIDWHGEFNSYWVPFSPNGAPTIIRSGNPDMRDLLYAISESDGADQTRVGATLGAIDRNGEPYAELGLIMNGDPGAQDQNGSPSDPQNAKGSGPRD